MGGKILDPLGVMGSKGTTVIVPPSPPPPAPSLADAQARAAQEGRNQQDALARKRGRQASVVTGPEGVASTPIQVKTLVGS